MQDDYARLFEYATRPMIIMDRDGKYLDHNEAYRKLMGYENKDDLAFFQPRDVSPKYQPSGILSSDLEAPNSAKAYEDGWYEFPWMHQKPNGDTFLSLVLLEVMEFRNQECLLVTIHDIDEKSKIKRLVDEQTEDIREKNRVLEALFSNSIVGLLISDENRVITKANQHMADILECEISDIEGKTMRNFHVSDEYYSEFGMIISKNLVQGTSLKREFPYVTMKGRSIWCEVSGNTLDHNTPPDLSKGMFWLIDDITNKKAIESELKEQYLLAKDANPLTELPGNNTIKRYLKQSVNDKADSAVLYIDLDHFKTYNDKYGFVLGDEILKFTADILVETGDRLNNEDYFVGNIGGDDFVVIVEAKWMNEVVDEIIGSFDEGIIEYYSTEDIANGAITSTDRDGTVKEFPIMGISVAGVRLSDVRGLNYIEVIDVCSEMKHEAKQIEGSYFSLNQRQIK